eukprot:CAMPEP_0195104376 /NCGR_PEP_ID=MMETSP0448-20130528/73064_1 /TAXON_ID=66468 /ORGANISM="Heterocapsa triquestra, Strain CCMP 448" /LENGTH=319 /DNA_ID=CAMNT_0040140207 /DNA_START=17 /DNA_END=976 /DNA_ORIENTATION=-
MAHGLHTIAHKNYTADGTGRDWFFLGDVNYRHGCVTPPPNAGVTRPAKPPSQPRGAPQEVVFQRLLKDSKKNRNERWKKHAGELPATCIGGASQLLAHEAGAGVRPQAIKSLRRRCPEPMSDPTGPHAQSFSVGWIEELKAAGVHHSTSSPELQHYKPGPGDHTRGIRGGNPHFRSSYFDLGQDHGLNISRKEVANAQELREARVIGRTALLTHEKELEGDHTRGIRGAGAKLSSLSSSYMDLGQSFPGWQQQKHQLEHAQVLRDAGVPPPLIPPKEIEGDHSKGIKGKVPHYAATYWELGKIPKWSKTRRKDDTGVYL